MENAPNVPSAQDNSARESFKIVAGVSLRAGMLLSLVDRALDEIEKALDTAPPLVPPVSYRSAGYATLTRVEQSLTAARAELEALHDASVELGKLTAAEVAQAGGAR